jgi:hypothetical protein
MGKRLAGGVTKTRSRVRGQRATPYPKGDPEDQWSHDLYEGPRQTRGAADLGNAGFLRRTLTGEQKTTVEISNLSYEVTEDELREILGEVGELSNVYIVFDRSGRSEGVARAVFDSREAANSAIREFDGAELEGQIINLSIVANDQGRRNAGGKRLLAGGSFQVEARGGRKVITRRGGGSGW